MATMAGQTTALSLEEQNFADRTIVAHSGKPGALLGILERIQEHHPHKYLSPEVLEYVAEKTDIPLAQIYSVVTFYALFNLEPQGDHTICICRGTACHTRGSRNLLERLRLELGLPEESEDGADKLCRHHAGPAVHASAPWPASASARWRRWSRWTTRSSAT